ncbi:transient receptor potential cation channel protein painless-like [Drosophila eugracilis]|uniref:transient receptor potential cation channel protein painless-like n=1 Tax=Drosophila eugracilis TaxID=29029 RepID=UPI001BD9E6F1|nr:transient receptor potential cation channel protein painless-like [Drosophila eugracilis]
MHLKRASYIDPQSQLILSLANQDIQRFVAALKGGARADQQIGLMMNIYEKALSTPGCRSFIRACIDHGCKVNYYNTRLMKTAVSFAADSIDPGNLEALLAFSPEGKSQVDIKYEYLTPLNSLADNLTEDNASAVLSCMRFLLECGASPNIVDLRNLTPLHKVLRKKVKAERLELVKLFLAQPDIDIDSFHWGNVRRLLKAEFPELRLPENRKSKMELDIKSLLLTLEDGDDDLFEQQFAVYKSMPGNLLKTDDWEYINLLKDCIRLGRQRALETILSSGVNINYRTITGNTTLFGVALHWGNSMALKILLATLKVELGSSSLLLRVAIDRLDDKPINGFNHQRCFLYLLKSDLVSINETYDDDQGPLAYAVKVRNTFAMKELLKHGAYIGSLNRYETLPIKDMLPEVLEEHFDSCITTNGNSRGEKDFGITIEYKNLIPVGVEVQDEMSPITFIAQSEEMRHLLQHPVISTFLFLKWRRLCVGFYLNFILSTVFTFFIIIHTLLRLYDSEYTAFFAVCKYLSYVGIGYLFIREAIQFMISRFRYVKSITNLLECSLIVLSILTCIKFNDKETERTVAAYTILLVSVDFCLLVGSLPVLSISTHMLMLREVSMNFLKSFSFYSIFVITFSLCFFIIFGKLPEKKDRLAGTTISPETTESTSSFLEEENKQDFDFTNIFVALIKTIVMMTGELNAGDITFTSVYSYLFLVIFIMFITIVLLNLLNGLAVNDTQNIKMQAELNGEICRVNLVSRYEQVLNSGGRPGLFNSHQTFRNICRLLKIFPNCLTPRYICIKPNDDRKVYAYMPWSHYTIVGSRLMKNYQEFRNGRLRWPSP